MLFKKTSHRKRICCLKKTYQNKIVLTKIMKRAFKLMMKTMIKLKLKEIQIILFKWIPRLFLKIESISIQLLIKPKRESTKNSIIKGSQVKDMEKSFIRSRKVMKAWVAQQSFLQKEVNLQIVLFKIKFLISSSLEV